jgi:hypothetical protein
MTTFLHISRIWMWNKGEDIRAFTLRNDQLEVDIPFPVASHPVAAYRVQSPEANLQMLIRTKRISKE